MFYIKFFSTRFFKKYLAACDKTCLWHKAFRVHSSEGGNILNSGFLI
jgi:hypothetical protein